MRIGWDILFTKMEESTQKARVVLAAMEELAKALPINLPVSCTDEATKLYMFSLHADVFPVHFRHQIKLP